MLVILSIVAMMLSMATLGSCKFMTYGNPGSVQGRSIDNLADDDIMTPITTATLGLLTWNPDMAGCRKYGDQKSDLSVAFQFARVVGVIAALFSIVGTVNVCVEFICCRCCCSRCTSTSLFITAAIAQSLTFVVYATDICLKSSTFECGYESGSSLSISAVIFLLISAVMSCSAPKARPLIRLLMELDRNQENDPCCYCFRKDSINRPPPSSKAEEGALKKSTSEMKATAEPEPVPIVDDNPDETGLDDDFYDTERNFVGQQIVVTSDRSGANSVPPDYYFYSSARQSAPNETLPYYATPAANQHTRIRNSMTGSRAYEQGNTFNRPAQYQRQSKVYSTLLHSVSL
jgi:hypothetical protein